MISGMRLLSGEPSVVIQSLQNHQDAFFISKQPSPHDLDRGKVEKDLQKRLKETATKDETKQIMEASKRPQTLTKAEDILQLVVNRAMINTLAHELKHSTEKPASAVAESTKDVFLVLPYLIPILAVFSERALHQGVYVPLFHDISSAGIAIATYNLSKTHVPMLAYRTDLGEIRARRFGRKIANDPQWQDLIKTGEGWNYSI